MLSERSPEMRGQGDPGRKVERYRPLDVASPYPVTIVGVKSELGSQFGQRETERIQKEL